MRLYPWVGEERHGTNERFWDGTEEGRLSPKIKIYKYMMVSVLHYRIVFSSAGLRDNLLVVSIYIYELRSRSSICHFPCCCEGGGGGVTKVGAFHPLATYPGIISQSVDHVQ